MYIHIHIYFYTHTHTYIYTSIRLNQIISYDVMWYGRSHQTGRSNTSAAARWWRAQLSALHSPRECCEGSQRPW